MHRSKFLLGLWTLLASASALSALAACDNSTFKNPGTGSNLGKGLPYSNPETAARLGYAAGLSWCKKTPPDSPIYWLTPDRALPCHQDRPIPKHYVKPSDFTNGTAAEREAAARVYNLGFYRGFVEGSDVVAPSSVSPSAVAGCP